MVSVVLMLLLVKVQTRRGARDQELQKMRKGNAEGGIRERSGRRRNLTSTLNATQVNSNGQFAEVCMLRLMFGIICLSYRWSSGCFLLRWLFYFEFELELMVLCKLLQFEV